MVNCEQFSQTEPNGKEVKTMQRSYNKLLGRIVEIFGTRGAFGKSMGWSDRTTSLKLNGKVDWKQDEIEAACQALKIEVSDIPDYFFAL